MSNKKRIKNRIYRIKIDLWLKQIRNNIGSIHCNIEFINLDGSFEDAQKRFEEQN